MIPITLSLNPTFLCNFRCEFCYLTHEQLADTKKISLEIIEKKIGEIEKSGYTVDHVDLYGGEIALLSEEYIEKLLDFFAMNSKPTINIITNLSKIHPAFLRDDVDLSVSYDFSCRQLSEQVFQNMIMVNRNISVLILASKELIKLDPLEMIQTLNALSNVISVEIKPYSTNQANDHHVTDKQYEQFILKWLDYKDHMNFQFINKDEIIRSFQKQRNAFSDNHVYLNPNGEFAVLEFDENDREYFMELNTFEDYLSWAQGEKEKVYNNAICSQCEFAGHCLTEHYRDVKSREQSCNGFFNLISHGAKL